MSDQVHYHRGVNRSETMVFEEPCGPHDSIPETLIPYFSCRHYSGKKRGIFRLRLDIDELFPVYGDPPEYLLDQSLTLFVGRPGV